MWRKVLNFDLGRVVMTAFEPITSQHFETTLSQNNVVSNAIKRDHWMAITWLFEGVKICKYVQNSSVKLRSLDESPSNMDKSANYLVQAKQNFTFKNTHSITERKSLWTVRGPWSATFPIMTNICSLNRIRQKKECVRWFTDMTKFRVSCCWWRRGIQVYWQVGQFVFLAVFTFAAP